MDMTDQQQISRQQFYSGAHFILPSGNEVLIDWVEPGSKVHCHYPAMSETSQGRNLVGFRIDWFAKYAQRLPR